MHGDFEDSTFEDDGQWEIAIWPFKPEVLLSPKVDVIKIPTANLRLSTTASSNKVSLDDCNNDRQPEMAAETGNTYISETVTDRHELPMANLGFTTMQSSKKCLKVILAATENRK